MFCSALPVLAALARHRQIQGARLIIVGWCLLLFGVDMLGWYIGRGLGLNNHFLSYIATPLQGATVLWALSLWQVKPVARLTLRLAIPPFLVSWIILTLLLEDTRNFSAVAEPVYSLLALGAALFTVLSRSSDEVSSLLEQDWFWICTGLALYFGALAVLTPLAAGFVNTNLELVSRAYVVRSIVTILAFVCISIGMLCPQSIRPGRSS